MQGIVLKMTFGFAEVRPGALVTELQYWNKDVSSATRVGGVTATVPWNPLTCFRTVSLKINNSLSSVEQYINDGQFGHASTNRFLRSFSSSGLENMDETLFTPCIESSLDFAAAVNTESGLSVESTARSLRWCQPPLSDSSESDEDSPGIYKCTKIIPFHLLFESCNSPAIWANTTRFRFEWTMHTPNEIPLRNIHSAGVTPYVFITDMQLMYDSNRMQPQQFLETSSEKASGVVEQLGFLYNEIYPVSYSPGTGSQITLTNQKNVQFTSLLYPSDSGVALAANVYINKYQYINNNITSLSASYGNSVPIKTPLVLAAATNNANGIHVRSDENALLYNLYKKCCGREVTKQLSCAITFSKMNQYHYYWIPFFNQSIGGHITNDPRDIRIYAGSAGGIAYAGNALLCVTKLEVIQIAPTGSVDSLGNR
jgi:hypothetical protein